MTATPSSPTASEIIAPAANDWQTLPPTVAVFHTLNDASRALAASGTMERAVHSAGGACGDRPCAQATKRAIVQVAPIRRPSAVTSRSGQSSVVRSTNPVVSGCGSLMSHVPPAMKASPGARARSSRVRALR